MNCVAQFFKLLYSTLLLISKSRELSQRCQSNADFYSVTKYNHTKWHCNVMFYLIKKIKFFSSKQKKWNEWAIDKNADHIALMYTTTE
jgi:hypothetical protein